MVLVVTVYCDMQGNESCVIIRYMKLYNFYVFPLLLLVDVCVSVAFWYKGMCGFLDVHVWGCIHGL